nr:hypothetical protein BaRGS_013323 [Batillaria attramentaria]
MVGVVMMMTTTMMMMTMMMMMMMTTSTTIIVVVIIIVVVVIIIIIIMYPDRPERTRGRSASFLKTPSPGTGRSTSPGSRRESRPQGLRACLDEEERGPSVSLVSGECEVLQINKKFFMRHCDDAIYSLIRLKNKPFPSEEDLIDRLDVNMQWEEFKQQTLSSFLKECRCAKR